MLVLCNVHIRSQTLNEQHEQITLFEGGKPLIFTFEWREPGAHCIAMEMSQWTYYMCMMTYVMSITTVRSFNSIQKKL